jgi:hypothetical protein
MRTADPFIPFRYLNVPSYCFWFVFVQNILIRVQCALCCLLAFHPKLKLEAHPWYGRLCKPPHVPYTKVTQNFHSANLCSLYNIPPKCDKSTVLANYWHKLPIKSNAPYHSHPQQQIIASYTHILSFSYSSSLLVDFY